MGSTDVQITPASEWERYEDRSMVSDYTAPEHVGEGGMTAPTPTAAECVANALYRALDPGGALLDALSDLLSAAEGVAMKAAGVPECDDPGAYWPDYDREFVLASIGGTIAEAMFRAALAHLEAAPA